MMNIERDSHKYQKKFLINSIKKSKKLKLTLDKIVLSDPDKPVSHIILQFIVFRNN